MKDLGPDRLAVAATHTIETPPASRPQRLVSLDVYRGLVMLILVPDLEGGFSFYRLAREFPGSILWSELTLQFRHAEWMGDWTGVTVWDVIMPSFLFLAAAAMPFSIAARRERGETESQIRMHVLMRAALLFVLGLLVQMSMDTRLDQLWPLILVCGGLPVGTLLAERIPSARAQVKQWQLAWAVVILVACSLHVAFNVAALGNYQFEGVLSQLAVASLIAYPLIGKPLRIQAMVAAAILLAYWLLFALWPVIPGPAPGVRPADELLTGFFAHWNKNANVGQVFEVWLLNVLPRGERFEFNPFGLVSVTVVPTIATMIFGIMAGELLRSGRRVDQIRTALLGWGTLGIAAGFVAGWTICPISKALWTPSFVLLTTGIVAVVLGVLYQICDVRGIRGWTLPFVVFGTNSILIYTLANSYHWRFATLPERLLGINLLVGPYAPLWESLLVASLLWCVAFVLYRLKVFIRI